MPTVKLNRKFRAVARLAPGARPGPLQAAVAEMFGIGLDETVEVAVLADLVLDVRPGDVVFVTGPSGSGKSVLLRALVEALVAIVPAARLADLAAIEVPADRSVIDGLGLGLDEALRLASTAGLADAFLLLRRPEELSDGQRWRLRLAHALARLVGDCGDGARRGGPMLLLAADELASTLDRPCARAVAYRLRRAADQWGITVVAASAHEDLLEDLAPDVLVVKEAAAGAEVYYADACRAEPPASSTGPGRRPGDAEAEAPR
jgi:ABC-type ATPase with predicted acetyltransferase domain